MDREDFTQRVTQMQQKMYRMSCGYLRSEQDRLDAISEAILKAWKNQMRLRQEGYFETWMMRIVINECIAVQRRQKRMLPTENIPEPLQEESPSDHCALVREAIDQLPERLRTVILLFYMEGYAVKEIAQTLHMTHGAVCASLSRGRKRLRGLIEENENEA